MCSSWAPPARARWRRRLCSSAPHGVGGIVAPGPEPVTAPDPVPVDSAGGRDRPPLSHAGRPGRSGRHFSGLRIVGRTPPVDEYKTKSERLQQDADLTAPEACPFTFPRLRDRSTTGSVGSHPATSAAAPRTSQSRDSAGGGGGHSRVDQDTGPDPMVLLRFSYLLPYQPMKLLRETLQTGWSSTGRVHVQASSRSWTTGDRSSRRASIGATDGWPLRWTPRELENLRSKYRI